MKTNQILIQLVLFLFCWPAFVSAQNFAVDGILLDEHKTPLEAATVVVLSKTNGMALAGGLSDRAGIFRLGGLSEGDYWLLATYVGYVPLRINLKLAGKPRPLHLDALLLRSDTNLLKEVQVTEEATPIIMRNDTIFYQVSSFKTRPNSAVIELLKKLPGIEVSADGKIRTEGKIVENVLVDGKMFFDGDPINSTRVLPTDAIERIEVYNQSSKKSDFTGIADPNRKKTINLILKKDRKKGWFGEAAAGAGGSKESDKRYDASINLNRFTPKVQKTIAGTLNNTGGNQNGFAKTQTLGLNLNQSLDKTETHTSILGNQNNQIFEITTARQLFLPEGNITSTGKRKEKQLEKAISGEFDISHSPDSVTMLAFRASGSMNQENGTEQTTNSTKDFAGIPLNASNRQNQSTSMSRSGDLDILFGRRSKHSRRNFTLSSNVGLEETKSDMAVFSANSFFETDGLLSQLDTTDQLAQQKSMLRQGGLTATFAEPIGKGNFFQAEFGLNFSDNHFDLATFEMENAKKRINDSLGNSFSNRSVQQRFGLQTQIRHGQWKNNFAVNAQIISLIGNEGKDAETAIFRKFWRILPSVSANRIFKKNNSLSIQYTTDMATPDPSLLQTPPDRSDPLNIREGNPNLKPELGHRFSLSHSIYDPKKSRSFVVNLNADYIQDRIIETITVDSFFVRRYRPQNMQSEASLGGKLSVGWTAKKLKSSFKFGLANNFSRGIAFLNDAQNVLNNTSMGQSSAWDFSPTEWFNLNITAMFIQNNLRYSVDKNLDQSYFDQNYKASLTLLLPKNWDFRSDFTLTDSRQRADGFNQTIPVWDISLTKRVLAGEKLEISFAVNDLLNRNTALKRTTNLNFVEDVQSNVLSRYFFLRVKYLMVEM